MGNTIHKQLRTRCRHTTWCPWWSHGHLSFFPPMARRAKSNSKMRNRTSGVKIST